LLCGHAVDWRDKADIAGVQILCTAAFDPDSMRLNAGTGCGVDSAAHVASANALCELAAGLPHKGSSETIVAGGTPE
jgi:hypothetical protein